MDIVKWLFLPRAQCITGPSPQLHTVILSELTLWHTCHRLEGFHPTNTELSLIVLGPLFAAWLNCGPRPQRKHLGTG